MGRSPSTAVGRNHHASAGVGKELQGRQRILQLGFIFGINANQNGLSFEFVWWDRVDAGNCHKVASQPSDGRLAVQKSNSSMFKGFGLNASSQNRQTRNP